MENQTEDPAPLHEEVACSECGHSPAPYEEDGSRLCQTHYLMRGMKKSSWRRLMSYDLVQGEDGREHLRDEDQNRESSLSKGQDTTSQSPPITQAPPS